MVAVVLLSMFAAWPQEPAPESRPVADPPAAIADDALVVGVDVVNDAPIARGGIVRASVPLPRARLRTPPADLRVLAATVTAPDGSSQTAPAIVLMRWPDESVAVLQVHFRADAPARGMARYRVEPRCRDSVAEACATSPTTSPVADELPIWTELADPWGRLYRGELRPDPSAGPRGVVSDSGLVCVRRFRAAHRGVDAACAGRPFLDLLAWVTTFAGERRAELVLALDDREPSVGPLGAVRFSSLCLCLGAAELRALPLFAAENELPPPFAGVDGSLRQWLLPPGGDHYLGDGTAKAFGFHLFVDGDDVDDATRAAAAWAPVRLCALPDLDAVRRSGAWGANGGPAPVAATDLGDAARQLQVWRAVARFGPYAGFGDPEDGDLVGAARHGDSVLHNVLRWRSASLLRVAEGLVLQHGLRPTGGRPARAPADTEPYRDGLLPAVLERPHGFAPIDYEHCAAGLLFDWFWLTGDPWARDELQRVGDSARRLLAAAEFRTSRGEGVCLEAGVLAARATGDAALRDALLQHARERTVPALSPEPAAVAIAQPAHAGVLDGREPFDAPAQMAQLVRGLCALQRATDAPDLVAAVRRVADVMAGSGWVEGEGPKTFVSAMDAGRYTVAATPADRAGADRMTIGAFVLASDLAGDPAAAARYRACAELLLDRELPVDAEPPVRSRAAANPWLQIALDRRRSP